MRTGSKIGPVHLRVEVSRFALATAAWVPEVPRGQLLAIAALFLTYPALAFAGTNAILPQNGQFVAGSGSIAGSSSSLTLTQTTQRAIVNWDSFSIGPAASVSINNGSGATLNRVIGADISQIFGKLTSTGSVYLVNPNGVVIGGSGLVVTNGSFVVSTTDISNNNFMTGGTLLFQGRNTGSVTNSGNVTSLNGDVFLIGSNVANDGVISATTGNVGLVAGQKVYLADSSVQNGAVKVELGAGDVRNIGTIRGAQVELNAAGGNIYALAGNDGGVISATGSGAKDGHVWLSASNSGILTVASAISAQNADGSGGTIIATGGTVSLTSTAKLNADGMTKGGTVLVGGDRQGGKNSATKLVTQTVATSKTTNVASGAVITANGTTGQGGNIVVWSDGATTFTGTASARGLVSGGYIETSGHTLSIANAKVDAGLGGNWLLDPDDLTIDVVEAGVLLGSLNGGTNITAQTSAPVSGGQGNITVATNIGWSTNATLTLSAYHDIVFNNGVTISNGTASTVSGGNLVLRADNTGTGSGTVKFTGTGINFADSTGSVSIYYNPLDGASASTVNATRYTTSVGYSGGSAGYTTEVNLGSKGASLSSYMLVNTIYDLQNISNSLSGTYALGTDIDATASNTWNAGSGFTPIGPVFTGKLDGLKLDGTTYTISNLTINQDGNSNIGLFAQIGTGGVVRNLAFTNAQITGSTYVGAVAGSNYGTITNVALNGTSNIAGGTSSADYVIGGIVGDNEGTLSYATVGSSITVGTPVGAGGFDIGGIAGQNGTTTGGQGMIDNVTNAATIYGDSYLGGIVGENTALVTNATNTGSINTGSPTNSAATYVGGIAGINDPNSLIIAATNSGSVGGFTNIGGLIGENDGKVLTSTSSAGVSGTNNVGGLVGANVGGTVTQSANTGGTTTGTAVLGGIVGDNEGTVNLSSSTGAVMGTDGTVNSSIGGAVGQNGNNATVSTSYATGNVSGGSGSTAVGGLVGDNQTNATVTQTYSSGTVNGTTSTGGLVGSNSGSVTTSYFNATNNTGTGVGSGTGSTAATPNVIATQLLDLQSSNFLPTAIDSNNWNQNVWVQSAPGTTAVFGAATSAASQVITGKAYTGTTSGTLNSGTVSAIQSRDGVNTVVGTSTIGSDGTYVLVLPANTLSSGRGVVVQLSGTGNAGDTLGTMGTGTALPGIDLRTGTFDIASSISNLSTAITQAGQAFAGTTPDGVVTLVNAQTLSLASGTTFVVNSGPFTIDAKLTSPGGIAVFNTGGNASAVVETAAGGVSATGLALLGGGIYTLQLGTNSIGTMAANAASVSLTNTGSLSIGAITDTNGNTTTGVTSTGSDKIATTGALTISSGAKLTSGATGDAIVLSVGTGFTNSEGNDALSTPNGRWLIGGLNPTQVPLTALNGLTPNFIQYNETYGSGAVASATGNGVLYASVLPTVTASLTGSVSKTYDGTTTATLAANNFSFTGAQAGDTIAFNALNNASYGDKNAGSAKQVTASGLSLSATRGAITVYGYQLASTTISAAIGTINQAALTATVVGANKIYDGTTADTGASISFTGLINGTDQVTAANATYSFGDKNVGTAKAVTVSGLTLGGTDGGNYNVTTTLGGTANISQKLLTAAVTANNKVYDGTTTETGTVSGLQGVVAGDSVSLSGTASLSFATKDAGTNKTVNVSGLSIGGADVGNYSFIGVANATATISPVTLTATAVGANKVYDGNTSDPGASYVVSGSVIAGDNVAVVGAATLGFDDKNAGTSKIVGVSGLVLNGTSAGNYALTFQDGTATITPKTLTAAFTANNKVYDGTTADTGSIGALQGVVSGDSVGLGGAASFNFDTKNVSNGKTVTVSGVSFGGADAGNYIFSGIGTVTANITPAALTATVIGANKIYDGSTTDAGATISLAGVVSADNVTASASGFSFNSKNVGAAQTVTASGLLVGGRDASNYTVTFRNGTASITPATLVAAVTGVNKTYDGTTTDAGASVAISGGVTGDNVAVTGTPVIAFSDKNTGTAKTVAVSGLSVGGSDAGNYILTIQNGAATITPKTLTASITASSKVYDGTTADTGSIGALQGVVSGDSVGPNGVASFNFDSKNVGSNKTVTVSGVGFSGADAGNYIFSGTNSTTASITPKSVSAVVIANNKTYDGTTIDTGSIGALQGVIGTDNLTLTGTASLNFDTKNVGVGKTVSVAGLALGGSDASNYVLSALNGTADITAKSLLIAVSSATTTYGTTPSLNVTYQGFISGDTVASALTGTPQISGVGVNAGTYTLTPSGVSALNGNYAISYSSGTLVVNPASLTIAANSVSVTQGTSPTFSVSYNGFANGETPAALTGALTLGGTAIGATAPGTYSIVPGGFSSVNYQIAYVNGSLNITNLSVMTSQSVTTSQSISGVILPASASSSGLPNSTWSSTGNGFSAFPTVIANVVLPDGIFNSATFDTSRGLITVFEPGNATTTRFSIDGLNGS